MQPNRLGRVLGVSARVAAEKLKEQAAKGTTRPVGITRPADSKTALPAATHPPGTAVPVDPRAAGADTARPAEQKTAGPSLRSGVAALRRGSEGAARAFAATTAPPSSGRAVPGRVDPAASANGGRRLARGVGRFGASLVKPFAHATGVLTLEITGVFFALFTLFFIEHAWQVYKKASWREGHFAVYAALAALFAWFAVTSFWRAKRKQRGR